MGIPGVCPQETGVVKEARQDVPDALKHQEENQRIANNAASGGADSPGPSKASAGNTGELLRISEVGHSCLDGLELPEVPDVEGRVSPLHEATSQSTHTGLPPGLQDTVGLEHHPARYFAKLIAFNSRDEYMIGRSGLLILVPLRCMQLCWLALD